MRVDFFATLKDFVEAVAEWRGAPLKFSISGMFSAPPSGECFYNVEQAATSGAGVDPDMTFLVGEGPIAISARKVAQRNGGALYCVDQLENPEWLSLRLSRVAGQRLLLPGLLGSDSDCESVKSLFTRLRSSFKRKWERIGGYLVGAEAAYLLDHGWRLTSTPKASSSYDLRR